MPSPGIGQKLIWVEPPCFALLLTPESEKPVSTGEESAARHRGTIVTPHPSRCLPCLWLFRRWTRSNLGGGEAVRIGIRLRGPGLDTPSISRLSRCFSQTSPSSNLANSRNSPLNPSPTSYPRSTPNYPCLVTPKLPFTYEVLLHHTCNLSSIQALVDFPPRPNPASLEHLLGKTPPILVISS